MIEITSDHFAQLVESIFQDVGVRLGGHAVERVRSPGGNLRLHENAVAVTVIQNAFVLGPMDARKNTIQCRGERNYFQL